MTAGESGIVRLQPEPVASRIRMSRKNKSEYRIGDESEAGEVVSAVIGSCSFFVVFTVKDRGFRWEVDDEAQPSHLGACLKMYDKLDYLIHSGFAKQNRHEFRVSNARALFASVSSTSKETALSSFDLIQTRILSEIETKSKIKYVASGTIVALGVCLIVGVVYQYDLADKLFPFYLGACMGSIGALLSVYQRCHSLEISPSTSPAQHAFLGFSRIALGLLCGGLLVVLVKANLFMGFAEGNLATLSIFAALSGFSERYFPNIINRLESEKSPTQRSNPPANR